MLFTLPAREAKLCSKTRIPTYDLFLLRYANITVLSCASCLVIPQRPKHLHPVQQSAYLPRQAPNHYCLVHVSAPRAPLLHEFAPELWADMQTFCPFLLHACTCNTYATCNQCSSPHKSYLISLLPPPSILIHKKSINAVLMPC